MSPARTLLLVAAALLVTTRPAASQAGRAVEGLPPPGRCEIGQPPELPATAPVRFVVLGDFGDPGPDGDGSLAPDARRVLAALAARHRERPYDFGLTVGDNFYPRGVATPEALRRRWRPYEQLGLRFYATLGNHDYAKGRARTQVRYTTSPLNRGQRWQMPCRYYSFEAGPVAFAALDTDEGTLGWWRRLRRAIALRFDSLPWSDTQARWLDTALGAAGRFPWRVVYGHHPVKSVGRHGDTSRLASGPNSLARLLDRHDAIYLAGHDHSLQVLAGPRAAYFVSGGGGRSPTSAECRRDPSCVFATGRAGFLEIEATADELRWAFIGPADDGGPAAELCGGTLTRRAGGGIDVAARRCSPDLAVARR
ncbi:MAG: metallophosphoesterase [Acidobacteria bacterium]|nr:metallophosphoesterase [Acidobacteriota bacterium]